eukprot:gene11863-22610_t
MLRRGAVRCVALPLCAVDFAVARGGRAARARPAEDAADGDVTGRYSGRGARMCGTVSVDSGRGPRHMGLGAYLGPGALWLHARPRAARPRGALGPGALWLQFGVAAGRSFVR